MGARDLQADNSALKRMVGTATGAVFLTYLQGVLNEISHALYEATSCIEERVKPHCNSFIQHLSGPTMVSSNLLSREKIRSDIRTDTRQFVNSFRYWLMFGTYNGIMFPQNDVPVYVLYMLNIDYKLHDL